MKLVQCAAWSLCLVLANCAMAGGPSEDLMVPLDLKQWKIRRTVESDSEHTVEWIRSNESIGQWTEMVTLQTLNKARLPPLPPAATSQLVAAADRIQKELQAHLQHVTWTVIKQDANSILYEVKIFDSAPTPDRHELGRLLEGQNNLFRVASIHNVKELPPAKRNELIEMLTSAVIMTK